jgi:hypothetical protein
VLVHLQFPQNRSLTSPLSFADLLLCFFMFLIIFFYHKKGNFKLIYLFINCLIASVLIFAFLAYLTLSLL